jgi:hypothetical protein
MPSSVSARVAWTLVALLLVLRHDYWFWSDRTLVFGFLPIGLLWQAGISVAAGVVWFAVSRCAWPDEIEAWADEAADGVANTHGGGDR